MIYVKMEASLQNLTSDSKRIDSGIEDDRKKIKSLQGLLDEGSITGAESDSIHQKSMHDINLCIEKIEELSMECKSLLSVIQDLERGNSEFLNDVARRRSRDGRRTEKGKEGEKDTGKPGSSGEKSEL
ncbi:UNVERIFIED_CONTAM: hypothetical protein PYX00_007498 [Menopon gallinae]|uniref:Uncharacterized protein n=1 Tax=Menopon gallinae TaxID=328185 RepID=A0AAW2HJ97_9NEOP